MPHVDLNGEIGLEDAFSRLPPRFVRGEHGMLKTAGAYLSRDKSSIPVEALVIEGKSRHSFPAMIGRRDDGLVVRIDPGTDVGKTSGVNRVLAEPAKRLLAAFPPLQIGATNLAEYLGSYAK